MTWSNLRSTLLASALWMVLVTPNMFAVTASDNREATAAGSNCTYYSDASHTMVVGRFGKDCCNNTVAWGRKTKFSSCGGCFPCTPPPR